MFCQQSVVHQTFVPRIHPLSSHDSKSNVRVRMTISSGMAYPFNAIMSQYEEIAVTRKEKLFQRLVNNRKNVKFSDFITVAEAFGFTPDRVRLFQVKDKAESW